MSTKKELIEKLIKDSVITLDEALVLLEKEHVPIYDYIPPVIYPVQPYYSNPWFGIIPPSNYPFNRILSTEGTTTIIPVNDTVTTICNYFDNYDPCTISYITIDPKCISYTMN